MIIKSISNSAVLNKLKTVFPIGVQYMLLSAIGFALMSACVKLVSHYGIPVVEIIAARAAISLLLSYMVVRRKKISIWGENKPLLVARGSIGALALFCVYYSVTTFPLAEATILQYLNPVFTAILALIILKEKIQRSTIVCILLSVLGLIVMVKQGLFFDYSSSLPWFNVTIALVGALGSAIAYVIVRKLTITEDSSVIIFYFPLIALPISVILMWNNFVMPNIEALILLIFVGLFTQVGQLGLTNAMKTESAGKATAYSYIQVIFSISLGFIIFQEVPSFWTLLGGGLIISGALINVLWKR